MSLGNPFAATGVRLLLTAAERLQTSGQRHAVAGTGRELFALMRSQVTSADRGASFLFGD